MARIRWDGEMVVMGLGGATGAWISDWVANQIAGLAAVGGWSAPIARFVLGAIALGWFRRGWADDFFTGFGVVSISLAVRDVMAILGLGFPTLPPITGAGAGAEGLFVGR